MPSLAELAALVGGKVMGDGGIEISGAAGLDGLRAGVITLGANEKAIEAALESPAAAVIVPERVTCLAKPGIRAANPRLAFARILAHFAPRQPCRPGVHASAAVGENFTDHGCQVGALVYIGNDVTVGRGTILHPGAVLGDRVVVGEDSVIHANVVIGEECRVGDRVEIHAGTVIGADGFGYVAAAGRQIKVPQAGIVVIEDDVEIGANSAVDRATTGVTLIKRGAKIDNLVQVAHNCTIGEDNLLCGGSGMAGSCILGARVILAARAGLLGHLKVGDDSVVAAYAKVTGDLPPRSFVSGDPARPHQRQMRIQASLGRLPGLVKEVRELRRMVTELREERHC